MNKNLPSSDKHLHNHQVITFIHSDKTAIQSGKLSLRRLTNQIAATVRATLVQAAEEYADHHGFNLVSTRHACPRFYVDGQALAVRVLSSARAQAFHGIRYDSVGNQHKLIENKGVHSSQ